LKLKSLNQDRILFWFHCQSQQ